MSANAVGSAADSLSAMEGPLGWPRLYRYMPPLWDADPESYRRWRLDSKAGGLERFIARCNALVKQRLYPSRDSFSRRSCLSCASSVIVAMGRASRRPREMGSPVISQ